MRVTRNFTEESRPRVSVTTLFYNGYGKYLPASLKSLAAQTFRDFEVILANDGSSDDSPRIARGLMEHYRGVMRITLLDLPHRGMTATRNAALSVARGDYCLDLPADDLLSKEFLEVGVSYLDEHPETSIVYFPYQNFGRETSFFLPPEFDPQVLKYWNYVSDQSLYRKDVYKALGGYATISTVYDDWDFWIRAAYHGFSFKRLTGTHFFYRRHVASATSRVTFFGENAARVWLSNREFFDSYDLEWAGKVLGEDVPRLEGTPRVLLLSDAFPPARNEEASFVARLSQELAMRGFYVETAVPLRNREYAYWNGAYIHEMGKKREGGIFLAGYEEKLAELLSSSQYDAVIICGRPGGWVARCTSRINARNSVFLPFIDENWYRILKRDAAVREQAVASLQGKNSMVAYKGWPFSGRFLRECGREHVSIPAGVDYSPAGRDLRRQFLIPWERKVLLAFYHREEYGKLLALLKVLSELKGDYMLLVLGWEIDLEHQEELWALHRESGRVLVIPYADEQMENAAMEAADLFIVYQDPDLIYGRLLRAAAHRLPHLFMGPEKRRLLPGGVHVAGDLSEGGREGDAEEGVATASEVMHDIAGVLAHAGGFKEAENAQGRRFSLMKRLAAGIAALAPWKPGEGEARPRPTSRKYVTLARGLDALLDDTARRQELGEEAYRHWRRHLDWKDTVSGVLKMCGLTQQMESGVNFRKNHKRPHPEFVTYLRSKEKDPLVSVIIPTKDRPGMLREAIASVLDQTYRNLEVIVVNDAGEDVTHVIESFHDGRLKYHRNEENVGLARARNVGVELSHGDYLCYLDDDDFYYPCHVETLVDALEEKGAKVAYTDSHLAVYEKRGDRWARTIKKVLFDFDFHRELLHANNYIHIVTLMHARDLIDEVGMFDGNLSVLEDWEFFLRLSDNREFIHVEKVTAQFRHRSDLSNMRSYRWDEFPKTVEVIDRKHSGLVSEARAGFANGLHRDGIPSLGRGHAEAVRRTLREGRERRLVESYQARRHDGDPYGEALSHLRRGMLEGPVSAALQRYAALAAVEAGELIMAVDFLDGALYGDPLFIDALIDMMVVEHHLRGSLKWAYTHLLRGLSLAGKKGELRKYMADVLRTAEGRLSQKMMAMVEEIVSQTRRHLDELR